MARPQRTTYEVLTLLPDRHVAAIPVRPGALGDQTTKVRRRERRARPGSDRGDCDRMLQAG